ncbi:MAG: hypothetical protein HQK60_14290 [Deltaproteobacteria bacterium]|nr:hypothetical protein [Deltaproteobacteria bacterium]
MKRDINIVSLIIRFVLAYAFWLGLFYGLGTAYARTFMPLFEAEIAFLHPEYETVNVGINAAERIYYEIGTRRPNPASENEVKTEAPCAGEVHTSSMSVHPIILLTIISAWPGLSSAARLKALALALPCLITIELVDIPFHFMCRVQICPNPARTSGYLLRSWCAVLNNGGRQFIPLIAPII